MVKRTAVTRSCPFCGEKILSDANSCRHCGMDLGDAEPATPKRRTIEHGGASYEYRSETELFGLPLVHIAQGIDPDTGGPRIARGIFASGGIAIGVFAVGGVAVGGLAIGGLGVGVVALAGAGFGLFAFGGLAVAVVLAAGGVAVAVSHAAGGLALAPHTISPAGADPDFWQQLGRWWTGLLDLFSGSGA